MATKKTEQKEEDLERLLKLEGELLFWKRFCLVAGKVVFYIGGGLYGALSFFTSTKEFWRGILRDFLK